MVLLARLNRRGFIINFNGIIIFKFLNLYAQPVSHVGARADVRPTLETKLRNLR
jgi:hypothetical protein